MKNATLSFENKVHILLAVWGEDFIRKFLQYGLPSLLSPGNIPVLAKTYQTIFVILTKSQDILFFEDSQAFQRLKSICDIEFVHIDDLISIGNHSTTLTYAFDRGIRKTKDEMLQTYFVLLNADYILAEGSFKGLMKYMEKGFSAICAGNFQVIENEMKPILNCYIDRNNQIIKMTPRELLKKSFRHFHPVTFASILTQDYLHNNQTNRFFLQHEGETLAGRFFLLHVLCIKPETKDYQIGASFDYSFVPEMCPSGNLYVINDSDDYLVIEMQPSNHELSNLSFGPFNVKQLVDNLAKWTTAIHRENVKHIIYYHTNDLSSETKSDLKTQSDKFINRLTLELQKYKAQPYRDHPYWQGATEAFKEVKNVVKNEKDYFYHDLTALDSVKDNKFKKACRSFLGHPPNVSRIHYRFIECQSIKKGIQQFLMSATHPENIVSLYHFSIESEFMSYCGWLKEEFNIAHHYHLSGLKKARSKTSHLHEHQFEQGMLFINIQDLHQIQDFFPMIHSILRPNANFLIYIYNMNKNQPAFIYDFLKDFASKMHYLNYPQFRITNISTINNNFTVLGAFTKSWIFHSFPNQKLRFFFYGLIAGPGLFLTFIRNCFGRKSTKEKSFCTSILVTLDLVGF